MKKVIYGVIALLVIAVVIWFWFPLRSIAVMSVYSSIHNRKSIMADNDFKIIIPGGLSTSGRDWFPYVMTFNAENYKARGGEIEGMTILYNFPAFNPMTRTNIFYEPDSSYNSAFYGAYIVEAATDVPYCYFSDGKIDYSEIMKAFKYDYKYLVLESMGQGDFEFLALKFSGSDKEYLGLTGWKKIQAVINTNSVTHNYDKYHRSYLQYGRPLQKADADFPETTMLGRLYVRFFPEFNSTIILYIMAPDLDVLNQCDEEILSKTMIIPNN